MIGKYTIYLVLPFFGRWPHWISAFFRSCALNPSITWLIFSDCGKPDNLPENVIYRDMTLDGFSKLASQKLGLTISLTNPYRLCDFKPFYGLIFEQYISDADFWGYCDADLVWGQIESFVTEPVLDSNDVISASNCILSGHFALFRNGAALRLAIDEFLSLKKTQQHLQGYGARVVMAERWFPEYLEYGRFGRLVLVSINFLVRHSMYQLQRIPGVRQAIRNAVATKLRDSYSSGLPYEISLAAFELYVKSSASFNAIGHCISWFKSAPGTAVRFSKNIWHVTIYDSTQDDATFTWANGRTFGSDGREWMYIHFMHWKNLPMFRTTQSANNSVADRMSISMDGVVIESTDPNK